MDKHLHLRLLGGFRAEAGGRVVPDGAWERPAARALVKLLAVQPGHCLHRDRIMDLLWPDLPLDSALNAFRKALHQARLALEPQQRARGQSAYLHLTDEVLRLDLDRCRVDADAFQSLARAALLGAALPAIEQALASYGGELLPGDRYDDWTAPRRDELAQLHERLLEAAAERCEAGGDLSGAVDALRQILDSDPTREDIHRALMRLYLRAGSRHRALRQYQSCRASLARELDIEPDEESVALYAQILSAPATSPLPRDTAALPASLRQRAAGPVIGRQHPLQTLTKALERAASGSGELALVSGEPGVGKSRLAMELALQAHERGIPVLWGAGYQQEGAAPYGPFVEALDGRLRSLDAHARTDLEDRYPELARLVPALAAAGAATPERKTERGEIYAAILRLLAELAADSTLVLVLDDLHAADGASLQLLEHISRTLPERPWLVLATFRREDAAAGSEAGQLVTRLTREGRARTVGLLRLARQDSDRLAESLLGGTAGPLLLEELYRRSLGSPLFLQELIAAMRASGEALAVDGRWQLNAGRVTAVPAGIQDLVEARTCGLGEQGRAALAAAAVVGMETTFGVLRQSTGLPENELLDGLDRALEGHLLEERGDGYAFRHPLIRAALYERLTRQRRVHLHGLVAEAIESEQPDEIEALAYHYSRSRQDEKALLYLQRAGDRAAGVYAHGTAIAHFGDLVARLDRLGRLLAAAAAREKLGKALRALNRFGEAIAAYHQAARSYGIAGDLAAEVRAVGSLGRVCGQCSRREEGMARMQELLDRCGGILPAESAPGFFNALAKLSFAGGEYERSLQAAVRATDGAIRSGDREAQAEGLYRQGNELLVRGRREAAAAKYREAVPLAEDPGNLELLSSILSNLSITLTELGRADESRAMSTRALELAERVGTIDGIVFALQKLARDEAALGNWAATRALLERALALAPPESSWSAKYALNTLGIIAGLEGNWVEARTRLNRALALAQQDGDPQAMTMVVQQIALVDVLSGRPEAAIARLGPLQPDMDVSSALGQELLLTLAFAYLRAGVLERAAHTMSRLFEQLPPDMSPARHARMLAFRGEVLTQQGRLDEAEADLSESVSCLGRMALPLEHAMALHAQGTLHARRHRDVAAEACFRQALAVFVRLGARPYQERAEVALTALWQKECAARPNHSI